MTGNSVPSSSSLILLVGSGSSYAGEVRAILREAWGHSGYMVDSTPIDYSRAIAKLSPNAADSTSKILFFLCPSTPGIRKLLFEDMRKLDLSMGPPLIHPSASLAEKSSLGPGTIVNRLVAIGSAVQIGHHVHLNRSCSIGHDTNISSFVTIGPGTTVTGSVNIGTGAYIGAGAVVLPGIRVGRNAVIGAGAVVTRNVKDFETVVGNPARVVPSKSGGSKGFGGYFV